MVVSVGGAPVGATATRAGRARGGRREVLRGLLASAAALAVAPLVAASRPARPAAPPPEDTAFDEIHRGRRIRGVRTTDAGTAAAAAGADTGAGAGSWHVTVDGRPLHLMRRADGTWISVIDHYRSYPTPLEAARAAVDELGPGERLRTAAPAHGGGGHHGVHA
ncbi:tyrosinase family oxidase copper chaperone [Streptomyces sp. NPDC004610]|uniref:tyrosinase family oxidase copper chaperone n=1 Tax=unclassified Streptomyces TaxID=2593676 RepID=UPI0033A44D24